MAPMLSIARLLRDELFETLGRLGGGVGGKNVIGATLGAPGVAHLISLIHINLIPEVNPTPVLVITVQAV